MRSLWGPLALLLIFCCSWLAQSCAGTESAASGPDSGRGSGGTPRPSLAQWPPFPTAPPSHGEPRTGSALHYVTLRGGDFDSKSASASLRLDLPGEPLQLAADAGAVSWAVYRFDQLGLSNSGYSVRVTQTDEDGAPVAAQPLWAAYADFDQGAWRWQLLPGSADGDYLLLDEGEVQSAGGSAWVALLCYDAVTALLDEVRLERECSPLVQNFAALGDQDGIQLSWDALPGASGYNIYYAEANSGAPEYLLLANIPDGLQVSFEHNASQPPGLEAVYGQTYLYRIEALGDPGPRLSCEVAGASFQLPAPASVSASFHLHSQQIRISWDEVPGADGYRIYRNEDDSLVDDVLAGNSAVIDSTAFVLDHLPHVYSVQAYLAALDSPRRNSNPGATANYRSFALSQEIDMAETNISGWLYQGAPVYAAFDYVVETPFMAFNSALNPVQADFSTHEVDTTYDGIGKSKSLIEIAGRLAVAGDYKGGVGLQYFRALVDAPASDSDWSRSTIDDMADGFNCRLASMDGTPAVVYIGANDELVHAYTNQTEPAGPGDWTKVVVDDSLTVQRCWLENIGSRAAIAYLTVDNSMIPAVYRLHYARAKTATPAAAADFALMELDPAAKARFALRLRAYNGRPLILYADHESLAPSLRLAYAQIEAPSAESEWDYTTVYESSSNGYSINSADFAQSILGCCIAFGEYGPADYRAYVLRSGFALPPDSAEPLLEEISAGPGPSGGLPVNVLTLNDGAPAIAFGDYDLISGSTFLYYMADQL